MVRNSCTPLLLGLLIDLVELTMCNRETCKWDVVGAFHAPHVSPCGAKEACMSDEAVCDTFNGM